MAEFLRHIVFYILFLKVHVALVRCTTIASETQQAVECRAPQLRSGVRLQNQLGLSILQYLA